MTTSPISPSPDSASVLPSPDSDDVDVYLDLSEADENALLNTDYLSLSEIEEVNRWQEEEHETWLRATRLEEAWDEEPEHYLPYPHSEKKSSWDAVDLADLLAGPLDELPPTYCPRSDGVPLIYRGKVSSIAGEPESCKGWFAMFASKSVLRLYEHVIYIDFEDSARGILSRMRAMRVSDEVLVRYFHVINPDVAFNDEGKQRLAWVLSQTLNGSDRLGLVVLDGITQALANQGADDYRGTEVAEFFHDLPRFITRVTGAAVLLVDHVTKSKEDRGRYAIGSQTKLAALDGAQFSAEVVTPFARGKQGRVRISVGKDRPGHVRAHATGDSHVQSICDMQLISFAESGHVKIILHPPEHRHLDDDGKTLPERLEQKIIDFLTNGKSDKTSTDIKAVVGGNNVARDRALNNLVDSGRVVVSNTRPRIYVLRG